MTNPDTDKSFDIIVNGRTYPVTHDEVSFDQVVDRAYPNGGRGPLIKYTVNYYNGAGRPTEGKLAEGQEAKVQDGTVFNVTRTDRS